MAIQRQRDHEHGPEDQVEAEGRGPDDGVMQTDIPPDLGGADPDEDEIEDEEDELDIIEDTDAPFRKIADLGGDEPVKDTQNSKDR